MQPPPITPVNISCGNVHSLKGQTLVVGPLINNGTGENKKIKNCLSQTVPFIQELEHPVYSNSVKVCLKIAATNIPTPRVTMNAASFSAGLD